LRKDLVPDSGSIQSADLRPRSQPDAGRRSVPSDDEILRRGLAAFAELGYEATSVRELARRLGVSHNFINDRYGSKDAFWKAAIDEAETGMAGRLFAILAAQYDDELQRFRDGIRAFHQAIATSPNLAMIMDYEATRNSERLHYIYKRHLAPVVDGLTPGLEKLRAAGLVRPFPLDVVLFSAIAMSNAVNVAPMLRLLGQTFDDGPEEFFAMLSDIVLDGLILD
jgi:AcrR family transcriptional regulator